MEHRDCCFDESLVKQSLTACLDFQMCFATSVDMKRES
jgi:hypothetical protein